MQLVMGAAVLVGRRAMGSLPGKCRRRRWRVGQGSRQRRCRLPRLVGVYVVIDIKDISAIRLISCLTLRGELAGLTPICDSNFLEKFVKVQWATFGVCFPTYMYGA